jgi:transcriptional regulator GlxA family with amidase domain
MFFNSEIAKLHSLNRDKSLNETEKSIKTLNLIYELSSVVSREDFSTSKQSIIDAKQISLVLSYIDNNYQEKITLTDLCKISNMSRSTLLNQFHLACSCSPSEYLLSVRIDKATYLLENTQLAIAMIAQDCGFYDSSHFTKFFLQKTGFLPKDYRNFINKK